MTTTGLCEMCGVDAAAPGEDRCRACIDYVADKRRQLLELVEQQRAQWSPHQGCTASAPCDECASTFFPEDAA